MGWLSGITDRKFGEQVLESKWEELACVGSRHGEKNSGPDEAQLRKPSLSLVSRPPAWLQPWAQGGGIRDEALGKQTPTDLFIKERAAKGDKLTLRATQAVFIPSIGLDT